MRRAIALSLAGVALWLVIRQVDPSSLIEALAGARPGWLLLALLAVVCTTGLKAMRWYVLLRRCRPRAPLVRFVRLLFIGQLANTLLPRMGDVVRGVWLGREVEGGVPAVLGSLVVEKALDTLLGLTLLLGLVLSTPLPSWLQRSLTGLSALAGTLLLLLFAVRASRVRLAALARRLPSGAGERIGRLAGDLLLGLDLLRAPADAWLSILLSAAIWALAVLTNVLAMRALGIDAPGWAAWLVVVTVYAATFLPTVPTQMGVFEYAAVLALQAGDVAPEPALAFGLILHFLVLAPPAVLGALSMMQEGIEWRGLQAAREVVKSR
jgi:uncharacterized membrane protein YbhN (UPF0104 family)